MDANFAISRAQFSDSDPVGRQIPGSVKKTASISIGAGHELGWFGSTRLRYFGPRPLIEDDSMRSNGSFIVNSRLGYRPNKKLTMALDVLNLFDRKVSDIDYFYTPRLQGEPAAGVADIHTHPTEPRELRFTVQYNY